MNQEKIELEIRLQAIEYVPTFMSARLLFWPLPVTTLLKRIVQRKICELPHPIN